MNAKTIMLGALSLVIVAGFFAVVGVKIWLGQDVQLEVGSMIGSFAAVIGYWFGSSSGSARKTEIMSQQHGGKA